MDTKKRVATNIANNIQVERVKSMKKLLPMLLSFLALCILTACVDFHPSDCPYGVWKCDSEGFNFTLDINPQVVKIVEDSGQAYSKSHLYSGEYTENGEPIEVYVDVFDPTNMLGILYINKVVEKEDKEKQGSLHTYYTIDGVIKVYSDDIEFLLSASYLVVDGRLRLRLTRDYAEKYGIDELYLDLVREYEMPVYDMED